MSIVIKNGRVIDPATQTDKIMDILVQDGHVVSVGTDININEHQVVDASGCFVIPGLIDLHVHFREPGFEYKETIKTGSMAAAKGGFTTVCPMPNTRPVVDCVETYEKVQDIIDRDAVVNVIQVASVTKGQLGEELTDLVALKKAGVIAISEDGKSVMNARLYEKAMEECARLGITMLAHCEDKNMVGKGAMNAGRKSAELGIPGITNAVEDVIVARDILIAKETGCRLHLCHCSTADSVKLIEMAKRDGVNVTGEVCPHHFTLTDEDIITDNADYKMNPPLRSAEDVEALRNGLKNNIMDAISTDHAPHSAEEKAKSIADAPFGITGLETSVALTMTELVDKGWLTPMQMVEKMSYNPARILGIDRGTLRPGSVADITIIDPSAEYVIDRNTFVSKGKNTPFDGKKVKGEVVMTMVAGKIVYNKQ